MTQDANRDSANIREETAASPAGPSASTAPTPGQPIPREGQNGPQTGKIERVIDVPLAVTLRFGQRHLTIRDVLALSTGSLVELDRQVEEPVELVLGDRLIARGEVVVVDGNYGLRVIEVIEGAAHRIERAHTAALQQRPAEEEVLA